MIEGAIDENSADSFESLGVCEPICKAIKAAGWTKPTQIQQQCLPFSLQGRDLIGLAQTGSGKTGAFAIPVLQKLLEKPSPFFAVVLAPTRELAFQICETFDALGSTIGVKTCVIVGGVDLMTQAIALAKKPHIVIATPGRLVDHMENTKGFTLKNMKFFVMDEADRMLSLHFEEELNKIIQNIPKERNTYLFSATMTSKVAKLQRASLNDPVKVEISAKYSTVDTLVQHYLFVPSKFKDVYLTHILNEMAGNTVMVFTATCNASYRLAIMLRNLGFGAIPLHGQMTQPKRLAALNKFKAGTQNILIATDVASRGLDIPGVDVVINYDVPPHAKDYVHRVGRTARAGRAGRAVTMVTQYDVELYQKIEDLIQKKLDVFPNEQDEVMLLLERVTEANRLAITELKEQEPRKRAQERERSGSSKEGGEPSDSKKRKMGGNHSGGKPKRSKK